MAPIFGLPVLGVVQAYGVALVVQTAKGWNLKSDEKSFSEAVSKAFILYPLISGGTLLCGYIAKRLF